MKDARYENWLTQNGLTFQYRPEIPLTAIDWHEKKALENIRLGSPLDDETVLCYALSMEQGDEFPALVVYPQNGQFHLISGNHRCKAYDLTKRKLVDGYVVDIDPAAEAVTIERLQRTANVVEGKPLSEEERMEQGMWLVQRGMTVADAARQMRVRAPVLADTLKTQRSYDLLTKVTGYSRRLVANDIGKRAANLLATLRHDAIIRDATKLAYEGRFTADLTDAFVKEVRAAKSDEDAHKVIADWRQRYAAQIRATAAGKIKAPAGTLRNFDVYHAKVRQLLEKEVANLDDPAIRRAHIQQLKRIVRDLEAAIRRLEQAQTRATAAVRTANAKHVHEARA